MRKEGEANVHAIWRRIADVFEGYVRRTDERRAHYAELGRLDASNHAETAANEERIRRLEVRAHLSLFGTLAFRCGCYGDVLFLKGKARQGVNKKGALMRIRLFSRRKC